MATPDTTTQAADLSVASLQQITAFMRSCAFEATRPGNKDIAALRDALAPGTMVYLTMLPNQTRDEAIAAAMGVREAGLVPVPHIAVRHLPGMADMDALLAAFNKQASVKRVLLIGGDIAKPAGSIRDVLSVIESGVLQANRISEIGVGGFPDGHPAMSEEELEANLVTKLAAIQNGGLAGHVVTQFSFDSGPIIRWIRWLRLRGITIPVHIGLAGPTSLMAWLNFARKCGVKASAEALANQSGLIKRAFKSVAPDPIIRQLAAAAQAEDLGHICPHLFAFGGIGATAQWAQPAIKGHIRLNNDGGYDSV
ncbi:MAG: methylenetetrahydrofolate reductase [Beijerinckiaceae bacterium]|jgi:methylenetetrahydrofolate reductase (NADPH)|nr:methylenetetrahydrofolate reductase [Beijerinckiaceae bacterium]